MPQSQIPPPPPGFQPVQDAAIPPPPAGFEPLPNGLEDYPVTQTGPKTFAGPTVNPQQSIVTDLENLGTGVAKGAANTLFNAGANFPMPSYMSGSGYTAHENVGSKPAELNPQGMAQGLGYGGEQAAEFFAPASLEGRFAAAAGDAAPFLGKTLPKIGAQALSTGTMNAAQGGSFGGGAAAGLFSGALGAGLKAIAPTMAETAVGVRGKDRAFGRTPGQAILQDTSGVRPSTIANQAESKIGSLTGELEGMHDAASQRLTQRPPIRGALPAPKVEIPLGGAPQVPDMPGGLFDAQRFPAQNVGEARVIRNPQGQIMPFGDRNVEFPDASGKLPPGRNYKGQMLSQKPTRQAFMTGAEGEVPETPPFSGPGVLLRDQTSFPAGDPSTPYRIPLGADAPSMGPARGVIQSNMENAVNQNSPQLFNALQPVQDQLSRNFFTGANIPERVTPTEMLGYKRGIGKLENSWPVETKKLGGDAIRGVYGALDSELDRTVPGSQQINQRISSLFPVASRANAADLNANLLQRSLGRFARPTGALASGIAGGYSGYKEGGGAGALAGGAAGLFVPEMLASPTTMMLGARGLDVFGQPIARAATGLGAQLFRKQSPPTK